MPSITRAAASPPPLSSGTLTFLVTDIEGSTRWWQDAPDAMQIALARHDVILRQGIETNAAMCSRRPATRSSRRSPRPCRACR
jgi:hypothetical protein